MRSPISQNFDGYDLRALLLLNMLLNFYGDFKFRLWLPILDFPKNKSSSLAFGPVAFEANLSD
uniref:Uncharacterized protein n=1 Tax=Rhizophora mucronata TaxID=61149 RepID=A0A2P2JXW1_RHIMU